MLSDLPDLPIGCTELAATTPPDSDAALKDHYETLPGLDYERFDLLREIARPTRPQQPGDPVLGLGNLLRQQANGQLAIHPRVAHIVPVKALDPLIAAIVPTADAVKLRNWYQFAHALLECQGDNPTVEALYPPEYPIQIADIVRGLRGRGVLTSVQRPGEPLTRRDELKTAASKMQDEDGRQLLSYMAVLHQHEDEFEPTLYLAEPSHPPAGLGRPYLEAICTDLFEQHGVSLDVESLPR